MSNRVSALWKSLFGHSQLDHPSRRQSPGRRRRRVRGIESLECRQVMAADPIPGLSDEFSDASTISDWQRVHIVEGWNAEQLQTYDINATQAGRMVQVPYTVVWYQDWRGPLAFKEVTGDFAFTTQIQINDRDNIGGSDADDIPGDALFSLAGAMIRTPRGFTNPSGWTPGSMVNDGTNNGENYVFLSFGYGNGSNQFSLEVKTTRNSNSQLQLTPLGQNANTATVQIARIGNAIITLYQLPGQDWQVHQRYSRPDMPATLQVGLVTYSDWDKANDYAPFTHNGTALIPGQVSNPTPSQPFNPDLVAGFEYARYVRPDVPAALVGANLADPTQANNAQLLSFLGENANVMETDPVEPPDDAPLVEVSFDITDTLGNPITEAIVGDEVQLNVYVEDLRDNPQGVFGAFLDVTYSTDMLDVAGAVGFGEDYPNSRQSNTDQDGLIDESGAHAGLDELDGARRLLFSVPLQTTAAGLALFESNLADLAPQHEVLLFGEAQPIPADRISFTGGSLAIVAGIATADDSYIVLQNSTDNLLPVLDNDNVSPAAVISEVSIAPNVGTAAVSADGRAILFTPAAGYCGETSLTYTVIDGAQQSAAQVAVAVHKVWHNSMQAHDVDGDGFVVPRDVLQIVNALNLNGARPLASVPSAADVLLPMLDVNDDGWLSALDGLQIINQLNQALSGSGEGEGDPMTAVTFYQFPGLELALQDLEDDDDDVLAMLAQEPSRSAS